MKSLDLAYTNSILIELLNSTERRTMTSLQNKATSYNTVKKTVYALKDDGLVDVETSKQGRKTFLVSLTPKGREVAKRSLALSDIASGKLVRPRFLTDEQEILIYLSKKDEENFGALKDKFLGAYGAVKGLAGLGLLTQEVKGENMAPLNKIKISQKGRKVAKHLKEIENILGGE
ncbi:MAG: hypothetical protein M0Z77_07380 [Thermoplasmatales archaeon]|nr:hypothetical protein [Thermoplasmatales archaeon]